MPWQIPTGTIDGVTPPTLAAGGAIFDELVAVDRYVQLSGIDYTPPAGANSIPFLWVLPAAAKVRLKSKSAHDPTWTGWYAPISDGGTLPLLTLSGAMYGEWIVADRFLLARDIDYEQLDATHVQLLAPLAPGAIILVAHHVTPQASGWERPRGVIVAGVVPDLVAMGSVDGEEIYAVDRLVQISGVDYSPDGTDLGQLQVIAPNAVVVLLNDSPVNPGSDDAGSLVHQRDVPGIATSRLLQQYRDATTPGVRETVQTTASEGQQLEDAAWSIIDNTPIDSATTFGVNLDVLGKIVGRPRSGLDDTEYLVWLKAQIKVNRSSGSINQILTIFALINPGATLLFVEQFPAAFALKVNGIEVLAPDIQAAILAVARKAGVRGVFEFSTVPAGQDFRFDVGPGFDNGSFAGATI